MRAVDTNLLVRLLVRDDAAQVKAAEEFVAGGAWVSQLVLAETIWVLDAVHERSAAQLAAAVEMLLNHERLTVQDADAVQRASRPSRARLFRLPGARDRAQGRAPAAGDVRSGVVETRGCAAGLIAESGFAVTGSGKAELRDASLWLLDPATLWRRASLRRWCRTRLVAMPNSQGRASGRSVS